MIYSTGLGFPMRITEGYKILPARSTAQCFSYGHATGLVVSLLIKNNELIRNIKGEELRMELDIG